MVSADWRILPVRAHFPRPTGAKPTSRKLLVDRLFFACRILRLAITLLGPPLMGCILLRIAVGKVIEVVHYLRLINRRISSGVRTR
jgi:hypothetical protein